MRVVSDTDCRTCGKKLASKNAGDLRFFPFCSERCKLIDLYKWVEGEYRIEGASNAGNGVS